MPLWALFLVFNECLNYGTLTISTENECQKVSKFSLMRNIGIYISYIFDLTLFNSTKIELKTLIHINYFKIEDFL